MMTGCGGKRWKVEKEEGEVMNGGIKISVSDLN